MRKSSIKRTTRETDISLELCLDGGDIRVDTGIGFFDHMLVSFAFHGGFGLVVEAKGDLRSDGHPPGGMWHRSRQAFREAIGDKKGIRRFASKFPMDEALAFAPRI